MTDRKRLVFWGPGHIGGAALREVLKSPDRFDVVGARVYSPDKHGRDVGELVGVGPIGVTATTETAEILSLDADCVVFTPLPLDHDQVTRDALALLRSGKNIVTTTSFHYPEMLGPEHVAQLEAACREGSATLHGTGIHPSFMAERLVLTLTGLFTDVHHIRTRWRLSSSPSSALVNHWTPLLPRDWGRCWLIRTTTGSWDTSPMRCSGRHPTNCASNTNITDFPPTVTTTFRT